jgi:MerR family transcriptional regulator/heat shock protein HspR
MSKEKRPFYMISVVAEMFDIHPQTLRAYEREGLLQPSRTEGNTRLYSQEDIERIELILRLTKDLGVNLAGVQVILSMRERIETMQRQVNQLLRAMTEVLERELKNLETKPREGLVPVGKQGLVRKIEVEQG